MLAGDGLEDEACTGARGEVSGERQGTGEMVGSGTPAAAQREQTVAPWPGWVPSEEWTRVGRERDQQVEAHTASCVCVCVVCVCVQGYTHVPGWSDRNPR